MDRRPLGKSNLLVTPLGFGAFKIGRNLASKYPRKFELPDVRSAHHLLNDLLDLGIGYIDTAPAYGTSEQRIGDALHHRRSEFTISTKAGETFENGKSTYDYSGSAITRSAQRSLQRLRSDHVDLLLIHSDGNDLHILQQTDAVDAMLALKRKGLARAVGFSGKTSEGFVAALDWADAIMVEFNPRNVDHLPVMQQAHERGIGVIVKKALASGHLPAAESIRFALGQDCVDSVVVGGLDLGHMRQNVATAMSRKK
ncbi:MAG: aldo/keto reductase [Phycisphaeraceae bacterium]|nr:aldo/keto reductase [Phycisphaeraceae bacterium]